MAINHIPKQNFENGTVSFSPTALLISSAPFSLLRFSLAFWALKSLLQDKLTKTQNSAAKIMHTICQSIETRRKCWYEALLVHSFFLNLLHHIDS